MRFPRNTQFDEQFASIPDIAWYPYVGEHFESVPRRVMVFAHNIPVHTEHYDERKSQWKSKTYWADCIEEYTYCRGTWTEAFRFFLKAACGLRGNYDASSDALITNRVDAFVRSIAYLNFIQDLVKSPGSLANADASQVSISRRVNRRIVSILGITHCICWGVQVFRHVIAMDGFRVISRESLPLQGFSVAVVEDDRGRQMRVLRIFHPSMPKFRPYSVETQRVIADFLK
jgi:hypothetical protein